jgi:uncharacterized membrane protein YbaN (DUF454 family)
VAASPPRPDDRHAADDVRTDAPAGAPTDDPTDAIERDPALATEALVRNPLLRGVLLGLGWLSVGLGALGVVLPGWPTTVWLLIAAFFFARSSPRFYRWLLTHRVFGPIVRDIRAGLGLPLRAKVFAISMIVLFAGGSAIFLGLARPWLGLLVAAVGAIGITYILRMPTRPARG